TPPWVALVITQLKTVAINLGPDDRALRSRVAAGTYRLGLDLVAAHGCSLIAHYEPRGSTGERLGLAIIGLDHDRHVLATSCATGAVDRADRALDRLTVAVLERGNVSVHVGVVIAVPPLVKLVGPGCGVQLGPVLGNKRDGAVDLL